MGNCNLQQLWMDGGMRVTWYLSIFLGLGAEFHRIQVSIRSHHSKSVNGSLPTNRKCMRTELCHVLLFLRRNYIPSQTNFHQSRWNTNKFQLSRVSAYFPGPKPKKCVREWDWSPVRLLNCDSHLRLHHMFSHFLFFHKPFAEVQSENGRLQTF